jgi:hypothetical protein
MDMQDDEKAMWAQFQTFREEQAGMGGGGGRGLFGPGYTAPALPRGLFGPGYTAPALPPAPVPKLWTADFDQNDVKSVVKNL